MIILCLTGIAAAAAIGLFELKSGDGKCSCDHPCDSQAVQPKTSTERIDELVAKMNASQSLNKMLLTADVVTALAEQQRELMLLVQELSSSRQDQRKAS